MKKPLIILYLLLSVSLFADFSSYRQNIENLRQLLLEKEAETQNLNEINTTLTKLQKQKQTWLNQRKIAKLTQHKAKKTDHIFVIIEEISALRKRCNSDFNTLYEKNFHTVDSLIGQLNTNPEKRKANLSQLLEEKGKRDFLLNSQKYFSTLDHKSFEIKQNFNVFDLANHELIDDLVALLESKILNIETAKASAQKEIKMRQKLNNFHSEISTIQEPETFTTTSSSTTESEKGIENSWNDESLSNYDNTVRGASGSFETYDELTNENDFLILFETKTNESMDNFLNRMDSLQSYYTDILKELLKRQ
ncbi:MAG: hypothetical protein JXQ65_05525 [Candidatus Marinimicrobia bacterium]|nr:hypothetical protein [Candidatus Neomarinimicrobiota bacterium]